MFIDYLGLVSRKEGHVIADVFQGSLSLYTIILVFKYKVKLSLCLTN
jgi:hypothetical protein